MSVQNAMHSRLIRILQNTRLTISMSDIGLQTAMLRQMSKIALPRIDNLLYCCFNLNSLCSRFIVNRVIMLLVLVTTPYTPKEGVIRHS